jgi:hypothetical protein
LDIEEDQLLRETGEVCTTIVNPAHIPFVPSGSWTIAVDSVQRRLEWWASALGINILRVDLPPPGGMGCSMAITPCETFLPGRARDPAIRALLPNNPLRRLAAWPVVRCRTEVLDNAGSRIIVRPIAAEDEDEAGVLTEGEARKDGEVPCAADLLGVRWTWHRLLLPEAARVTRSLSSGSLQIEGVSGTIWTAWPIQNRVRTTFAQLWAGPSPETEESSARR